MLPLTCPVVNESGDVTEYVDTLMNITDWLGIIRAEFLEIPGLCLTKPQVQRLWGLDPVTAEALLTTLVDVRFLRQTRQGAYMRRDVG